MKFSKSIILTLFLLLSFSSCKYVMKNSVNQTLLGLRLFLPNKLDNTVSLDSINIVDDKAVYVFHVSEGGSDVIDTELYLSMLVAENRALFKEMEMAEMGVKTVFRQSNTEEIIAEDEFGPEVLGKLYDLPVLESFKRDINSTEFPFEVNENIYCVSAKVEDNVILYELVYDVDIDKEDIDIPEEAVEGERNLTIENLRSSLSHFKNDSTFKDVVFRYNIKSRNGEMLYSYDVNGYEVFN